MLQQINSDTSIFSSHFCSYICLHGQELKWERRGIVKHLTTTVIPVISVSAGVRSFWFSAVRRDTDMCLITLSSYVVQWAPPVVQFC